MRSRTLKKLYTLPKILSLLLLASLGIDANADEVKSLAELALLPAYCKGTQQIRLISKDSKSVQQYEQIYGEAFRHLHHYCWALNSENNALRSSDAYLKQSKLNHALGDYKYFLDRAPPTFSLLPEIYTSRSGVLFKLNRNEEAVRDLNRVIELKAGYALAYSRLNDYYQGVGDKGSAIKILERALNNISNTHSVTFFTKELEKLGRPYQGIAGNAIKEKDTNSNADNSSPQIENTTPDVANKPTSADTPIKPNPYCRFCP